MRTRFTRDIASLTPRILFAALVPALASVFAASCAGGGATAGGGSNAGGSGSGTNVGGAGEGGSGGGATTTTTTSSTGGSETKCASDADCAGSPKGPYCHVDTGACVQCLPSNDVCLPGQFCDPATNACAAGCTDASDCTSAPAVLCDVASNTCVACLQDTDCGVGTICVIGTCVPGCSPTQDCLDGLTCCGSNCYDLQSNPEHCGDCANACPTPDNAASVCSAGMCQMGACNAGWADCDGVAGTGCERNVLQDGACVCAPGETQACYYGAPGTQNVGPCHAGTQTCDASGVAWGPCVGQVMPVSEICANNVDEDCDGFLDNVKDIDGDGWTTCNGDCCEAPGPNCNTPKLVNPGAFEVIGNGVNDDCDAQSSDVAAPPACSTVADFSGVTASDVAKAMDICQTTTANAPLPTKKWGLLTAAHRLANGAAPSAGQLSDMQNWQTAILLNYGTGGVTPKKGTTMAGISTGRMRDQNDAGYVDPNGGTEFTWTSLPPAAYLASHGGNLPSSAGCSGGCPAGDGANDSVNIRIQLRVPTNAQSFSYDFRFATAEYWTWACSDYNDFFLAILQTAAPGIPADKNISFDGQNNPVSVNNGFFDVCVAKGCYNCPAGSAALAGTGLQIGNTGGMTKWLTTDAPIVPGETMQIELMIFDVSDWVLDSIVLLDNFRWNLQSSTVSTHE